MRICETVFCSLKNMKLHLDGKGEGIYLGTRRPLLVEGLAECFPGFACYEESEPGPWASAQHFPVGQDWGPFGAS